LPSVASVGVGDFQNDSAKIRLNQPNAFTGGTGHEPVHLLQTRLVSKTSGAISETALVSGGRNGLGP